MSNDIDAHLVNVGGCGVGQVEEQVVLVAGEVHTARRLPLSLTVDHRVIDGAPVARFLQTVGRLLAEPGQLL